MAKSIDLLGYGEITLNGASNACVQKSCGRNVAKRKVATEDAVKGDKPSNGLFEKTVVLLNKEVPHWSTCRGWWNNR